MPRRQPKRGRLWLNDGSCIRLRPLHKNHVWSYDFVNTRTHDGRPLKLLTVLDESMRQCMAIKVAQKIRAHDVFEVLADLFARHGPPEHLRSDNGPEFTAKLVRQWLARLGVQTLLHRARQSLGKRLQRELQRQAEGRVPERGRSSTRWRRRPCWSSNGGASTIPSDPTAPAAAFPRPPEAIKPSPWFLRMPVLHGPPQVLGLT